MRRENVWRRVRGDRRQYWQRWPRWSDPRGIRGIARYSLATPYTRRLDPWPIEPTFCLCFSFASSTFFLSLFFFFFWFLALWNDFLLFPPFAPYFFSLGASLTVSRYISAVLLVLYDFRWWMVINVFNVSTIHLW